MKTAILIDAKNAAFRFGWAFKTLRSSAGEYTGASYGLMQLLLRLKRKFPEGKFIMIWDGPGKSWRHEYWEGYKANRVKEGPILEGVQRILGQLPTMTKLGQLIGIPQFIVPGLEGDDGISLVAHRLLKEKKYKVVVYSSDKDFIQLMPLGVQLIPNADEPVNEGWVNLKFRCTPDKVLLVRAIAGDSSDGIPGILDGVGAVRASQLIHAGCNPGFESFKMHDKKVRPAISHMQQYWDDVHRNYRLMRLMDISMVDKLCKNPKLVCATVEKVVSDLEHVRLTHLEYNSFLRTISSMEMLEIIGERRALFAIQR